MVGVGSGTGSVGRVVATTVGVAAGAAGAVGVVAGAVTVGVGVGAGAAAFFFLGVHDMESVITKSASRNLIASNPYTTSASVILTGYAKTTRHRKLSVQKTC